MHFPHDPQQPGPVYFLTPRKCGIFGVHCEAISRQVCTTGKKIYGEVIIIQYLVDEGMNIGKGANYIISLVHHFLSTYNLGETNLLPCR